uniref:Uncharacterized protein n=1 Tax=Setaria viridis TaxID=4556 RepID=A0A4U6VMD2_SETVI|nr:hypothetical protein SEVIR_3G353800v2 [Setaria viridis]
MRLLLTCTCRPTTSICPAQARARKVFSMPGRLDEPDWLWAMQGTAGRRCRPPVPPPASRVVAAVPPRRCSPASHVAVPSRRRRRYRPPEPPPPLPGPRAAAAVASRCRRCRPPTSLLPSPPRRHPLAPPLTGPYAAIPSHRRSPAPAPPMGKIREMGGGLESGG